MLDTVVNLRYTPLCVVFVHFLAHCCDFFSFPSPIFVFFFISEALLPKFLMAPKFPIAIYMYLFSNSDSFDSKQFVETHEAHSVEKLP